MSIGEILPIMQGMVRTRIAPSPTGYPHIGTIYQALFNYAFAKHREGKFLVRIEDTDRGRFVEGSEDVIFKSLDWFDLVEDESARKGGDYGPYRQSERLDIYHQYAQELVDKDLAFFAYYPKEDAGKKKDYTSKDTTNVATTDEKPPTTVKEMLERGDWILRMRIPKDETIVVQDEIRGDITFDSNQVTEQVLIKSDGFPTYHLAAVVDDHLMGITHVVRAEEWLSSLPKHVLLYRYFGWDMPPVYHTVTLRNPDKSKLSKRHGHTNVLWFQEEGFLPEAILNFLALLGWSHPEEKEIFSLEEFMKLFNLKDISTAAPIFDLTKLRWMNQQYIQSKSNDELKELVIAFYPKSKELPDQTLDRLMDLVKTRMETLKEFEPQTSIFFASQLAELTDPKEKELAKELYENMVAISEWNHVMIFGEMKKVMLAHKVRMSVFYKILTGSERGLPLPEVLDILGKDKTLSLLKQII